MPKVRKPSSQRQNVAKHGRAGKHENTSNSGPLATIAAPCVSKMDIKKWEKYSIALDATIEKRVLRELEAARLIKKYGWKIKTIHQMG